MITKMLKVQSARDKPITIKEPLSYAGNVMKNRMWYRGDPSELDQFFKRSVIDDVTLSRFWAAVPSTGYIRKFHSGLPAIIVERLTDIVVSDIDTIMVNGEMPKEGSTKVWEDIAKENDFNDILSQAVIETLVTGDGAFKISIDTDISLYPIIEFFSGENVEYRREKGRLKEILFYRTYEKGQKEYRLTCICGRGYIRNKLYDESGQEKPLTMFEETKGLQDATFEGDFIMGVPVVFFKSPKFEGRGKGVYDGKSDSFDALDETISQWVDAIRDGRVNKYIPDNIVPKNRETGELMSPNPFDNKFIAVRSTMSESGDANKIEVVQPTINYDAYVNTYASNIDMCLQGIISPSTLGIDLKKTDNAESQREKEKATLYSRGKIIDSLTEVIPQLISIVLQANDMLYQQAPGSYEAVIEFGEYGSPTFEQTVKTIGEAAQYELMSIETRVEALWGDRKDEDWKTNEIARLKALMGVAEMEEPSVNTQLEGFAVNEVENDKANILNGAQIASLMSVIKMVKEGSVTRNEAIAIITATLGVSREDAEGFIEEGITNAGKSGKQNVSNEPKRV